MALSCRTSPARFAPDGYGFYDVAGLRVARTCASSTGWLTLTQPHARAFAFSWSNSAWVIVPASRSCLADAI